MQTDQYIVKSLELHLFFGRIMKEHSLFLRAGFMSVNALFSRRAEFFRREFEHLLRRALALSDGIVSPAVLCSGELATEFTVLAETQTEALTGIPIDRALTAATLRRAEHCRQITPHSSLRCAVRQLNRRAIELLNGLISLKEQILENVLCGKMFTANYPLLIEHILREAKLYRDFVDTLERDGCLRDGSMRETERFWNQIMMEHALFLRGLFDPCETELIRTADGFAKRYAELPEGSRSRQQQSTVSASLAETKKFRDFKAAGTQGIEQCKIRSVILPLLGDHVLREANHYIRLLET